MPFVREVHHRTIPLAARVYDASLGYEHLTLSLIAVEVGEVRDGKPVVGYGISPIGWHAPAGVLEQRLIPRLLALPDDELLDGRSGEPDPLLALGAVLADEPPGSNGECSVAAATLEMALWDVAAKLAEQPLAQLLAERFSRGRRAAAVEVVAAGGFYRTDVELPLSSEIQRLRGRGYAALEIRVGGAELSDDLDAVASGIATLGDPGLLAVNAGCALDIDRAAAYAEALTDLELRWFAEAGDPLDYEMFEELTEIYDPPLAAGSRLLAFGETDNLLRYSALRPGYDLLMLDPAACGLSIQLAVRDLLPEYGWTALSLIAAGGQPLYALQVAAGLGLGGSIAMPATFAPFGDLGDDVRLIDGNAELPDAPGIGFETHSELMAVLRGTLGS